jgi:hypothetical protein
LGSRLESLLVLCDSSGKVLKKAGENENSPDAVLVYKLPGEGVYRLSITDREKSGGPNHFYRVDAGPLPYITGVFPLGVRAGEPAEVSVRGVNLGGSHQVEVHPPKWADGWTTAPIQVKSGEQWSLNKVSLAVGNEPEILEREPNNTAGDAEAVSVPVTINGHISSGGPASEKTDEDYFRFHANKGQRLDIQVAAGRLGSPLDSVIEVLDAQGHAIPRATVRCENQTVTTLADRDSRTMGIRLVSTSSLHEGDYLMIGDELDRVAFIPDQPDADLEMEGTDGMRLAFLGTSPDVHAVNTPVYKAEILPAGAKYPPNGLPVFHLTWRNDDGGPGYGADSRLDFVAPADGDYILHLKDVRGLEGPDYAYRLSIRDAVPDYRLEAEPDNPNVPRGGSIPISVRADRLPGYEGPVDIQVEGLPSGVTAGRARIPAGQNSTVVVLSADANASGDALPAPIKIMGHASVAGRDLVRIANKGEPLQLTSVIPSPDVSVTAEPAEVAVEPGKIVNVTLHVRRQNGFRGRVPCAVENLPPGVRVVNVGLNGVLVTETQSSRTFALRAEDWAKPITQPIYVVARVESNSPTMHPSAPIMLDVVSGNGIQAGGSVRGDAHASGEAAHQAAARHDPPPPPKDVAGIPVNYDEALAGSYTLPDPLVLNDGKPVRNANTWYKKRRPEIVHLFEEDQFGRSPGRPAHMSFDVFDRGAPAFDGKAIRRQVTIYFSADKSGPKMDLLIYTPADAKKPVPLLLNISFTANSNSVDDPGVKPGEVWGRDKKKVPAKGSRVFGRLDVRRLIEKGYGVATFYYGDVDPDFLGGLPYGVRALYLKPGQTEPAPDEWGSIAAWAWGLSRAMDYIETDRAVDAKRVTLMGVSRLGKTVLWAGAHDTRFAMVIASCSGEGGAALSRRNYGETIAHLTAPTRFPYQFCANYAKGAAHPDQRPIDAHMLIALIAPRPLLLQTGDKDLWSDPKGEFLAGVAAGPVYRLLGKDGLDTTQWPAAGEPILHTLGYYMHSGGHGTVPSDWDIFLRFMDMHLRPED